MAAAFALSIFLTWKAQARTSWNNVRNLLSLNIQDVCQDVDDASENNMLKLTKEIADQLNAQEGEITSGKLYSLMDQFDVSEINVIDANGISSPPPIPLS